jgi:hypothetical protein
VTRFVVPWLLATTVLLGDLGCASVVQVPVRPADDAALATRLNRQAAGRAMLLVPAPATPELAPAVTIDLLDTERIVYKDLQRRDHMAPISAVSAIRVPGNYEKPAAVVAGIVFAVVAGVVVSLQNERSDQEIPNFVVGPLLAIPAGLFGVLVGLKVGAIFPRDTVYELAR